MLSSLRTGAVGQGFDAGQVDGPVVLQRLGGGGQFLVGVHVRHQALDAFARCVVAVERFENVALGGHHGTNLVAQKRAQLVLDGEILRIAQGDGQRVVAKADGHDAIHLGHGVGDQPQHVGRHDRIGQMDDLHVPLLGQSLGQLLLVDEILSLGNLAQQLPGMLLLFFQQRFELLVGDETEVDQDLSDATNRHENVLAVVLFLGSGCVVLVCRAGVLRKLPGYFLPFFALCSTSSSSSNTPRSAAAMRAANSSGAAALARMSSFVTS